jgi:hypothetical protein
MLTLPRCFNSPRCVLTLYPGVCYTPELFSRVLRWCRRSCPHVVCVLQGGYQAEPLAASV